MRSVILGCGAYLPERVLTNADLEKMVDTTDEWIVSRSGIRERHIAADDQFTSHLAINAAKEAIENAGISVDDLDQIIVGTTTPDETFPSTATRVQAALGMTRGVAYDVQAACSGFIFGLAIADNFIKTGAARYILVIGAETLSRITDWTDRTTCVLFGDGAGAVVLKAEEGDAPAKDGGILSTHLHSDGNLHDLLYATGGVSSTQSTGTIFMEGRQVFKHAVINLASVVEEAVKANGLEISDVDWFVPHQANLRILESTAKRLGLSEDQVVLTVQEHGNTSAASVPLALAQAVGDGRIKRGDLLLLEAMGGGFTWGAALVRF